MKIQIQREACCAADDQLGPLDLSLDVPDSATLQSLAQTLQASRFLQFSSTHHTLHGESAGRLLLSISSAYHGSGEVVYFVDAATPIIAAAPDGRMAFSFRLP